MYCLLFPHRRARHRAQPVRGRTSGVAFRKGRCRLRMATGVGRTFTGPVIYPRPPLFCLPAPSDRPGYPAFTGRTPWVLVTGAEPLNGLSMRGHFRVPHQTKVTREKWATWLP